MDIIQEKLGLVRFDHRLWLNEIHFALKEIEIFENRLLHLLEQYNDSEEGTQLEIFLHEFDLIRKSTSVLQEQIKKHLNNMQLKISSNGHLESITNTHHSNTKVKMGNFRKNFDNLKERFHKFGALKGKG